MGFVPSPTLRGGCNPQRPLARYHGARRAWSLSQPPPSVIDAVEHLWLHQHTHLLRVGAALVRLPGTSGQDRTVARSARVPKAWPVFLQTNRSKTLFGQSLPLLPASRGIDPLACVHRSLRRRRSVAAAPDGRRLCTRQPFKRDPPSESLPPPIRCGIVKGQIGHASTETLRHSQSDYLRCLSSFVSIPPPLRFSAPFRAFSPLRK